jgi:uncharacterized protein (UPF0335 family)
MEAGHNSQLKSLVERIETIEEQVREFNKDKAEIYLEAKGNGYDVPALRAIVRARREDPEKRRNREAMIDLYSSELGID